MPSNRMAQRQRLPVDDPRSLCTPIMSFPIICHFITHLTALLSVHVAIKASKCCHFSYLNCDLRTARLLSALAVGCFPLSLRRIGLVSLLLRNLQWERKAAHLNLCTGFSRRLEGLENAKSRKCTHKLILIVKNSAIYSARAPSGIHEAN